MWKLLDCNLRKKSSGLIAFTIVLVLVVLLFSAIGYFLAKFQESSSVKIGMSGTIGISTSVSVTITRAPRYVHLEVSPMAFPVIGRSWSLFVYSENISSDKVTDTSIPNATIIITAKNESQTRIYKVNVDELGRGDFPFLGQYGDIAFQAEYNGNQSEIVTISNHYQPLETVDNLLAISGLALPASGVGVGTGVVVRNKKMRLAMTTLFACILTIFIVLFSFSVYSRTYLGSIWGYPENITEFVSLTLLKDISFIGFVLLMVSWVIVGTLKLNDFRKGKKSS